LPYMFNIAVFLCAYLFLYGEAQRVLRTAVSIVAFLILCFVQFPRIFLEMRENRRVEINLLVFKMQVLNFFSRPVNVLRFFINVLQTICVISDREVWHKDHDALFGAENEILVTTIHHWFMTFIIVLFFPVIVDAFVLEKNLGRIKIQIQGCTNEMPVVVPVLLILYLGFSGAILCCESAQVVLLAGLDQQSTKNCHLIGEGYLCGHTPPYVLSDDYALQEYVKDSKSIYPPYKAIHGYICDYDKLDKEEEAFDLGYDKKYCPAGSYDNAEFDNHQWVGHNRNIVNGVNVGIADTALYKTSHQMHQNKYYEWKAAAYDSKNDWLDYKGNPKMTTDPRGELNTCIDPVGYGTFNDVDHEYHYTIQINDDAAMDDLSCYWGKDKYGNPVPSCAQWRWGAKGEMRPDPNNPGQMFKVEGLIEYPANSGQWKTPAYVKQQGETISLLHFNFDDSDHKPSSYDEIPRGYTRNGVIVPQGTLYRKYPGGNQYPAEEYPYGSGKYHIPNTSICDNLYDKNEDKYFWKRAKGMKKDCNPTTGYCPKYMYQRPAYIPGNIVYGYSYGERHHWKLENLFYVGQKTFLDNESLFFTGDQFMDHSYSLTSLMTISFSNYGLVPTSLSLEEEFFLIIFCIITIMYYMNILFAGFAAKAYYIYDEIEALLAMGKTKEIIEIESLMTKQSKLDFWDSMHFEKQVPFMLGDTGLTGGLETSELLTSRYVAPEQVDNIIRYTGKADKDLPWPTDNTDTNESADAQLDKQLRGLKKLYKQARQILRSEAGHGSGSGNDGSSNDNSDED